MSGPLANPRHELFSVLVARGELTQPECYLKAGYKCSRKSAEVNAARLLGSADTGCRGRVAELQAMWAKHAGVTTTDVIRWARAIASFDLRKAMSWKTDRRGRLKVRLVDSDKLDDDTALALRGLRLTANGPEFITHEKSAMITRLGEHMGMFQGENAGNVTMADNSQHVVYVDAPQHETAAEWQARVARERGIELVEGKGT